MSMDFIRLDAEKCVKCGCCITDCPTCVLEMGDEGPQVREDQCIECGHCVSVCPTEAIDNLRTPRDKQETIDPAKLPTPEEAAYFLRTRRSIRGFKKERVPRETIDRLLNIARIAPTGGNTQNVHFHIIDNRETLKEITAASMAWAEKRLDLAPHLASMVAFHRATGWDNVLRNAPCMILALMDESTKPMFRQNGRFMLTYAELYAPMTGLGSCWAGWAEAAAIDGDPQLLRLLKLPKGKIVTGAIVAGYPRYHHKRIPARQPLRVTWVD
ncbi:MAG: 4Fe-4S binding protein [Lentisphaeria bacterium]|nr:4Fe-4S binding protein [Lentisphaeria bacterium]